MKRGRVLLFEKFNITIQQGNGDSYVVAVNFYWMNELRKKMHNEEN